jgi:endonuclease/exonuclease/phosphatase family metal-dependent hydrolase
VLRLCFVLTLALLGACSGAASAPAAPTLDEQARPLVVMSFNVRYGTATDGLDAWPLRSSALVARIREAAPDVLGVQEALDFQVEFLERALPTHVRLGQGREGGARGEHSALFVHRSRFDVLEHRDFWLSETPELVASVGWDAALTRMCTWARLRERVSGREFSVWNTHFDHRGPLARERSAQLIAARLAQRGGAHIVLGDLNAGEDEPPLGALRAAGLVDAFRALHPDVQQVGTFHDFRGGLDGARIDFVLATDDFMPLAASILSAPAANGRWPSDHHPVVAVYAIRSASRR